MRDMFGNWASRRGLGSEIAGVEPQRKRCGKGKACEWTLLEH